MASESPWVEALAEKVNAAVRRIKTLRAENEALTRRVHDLEAKLAADGGEPADWSAERAEIRRRVEQLTEQLEELLAAANEDVEAD
jgi:chromosome segregation ATPase